jgi:NADH-quinone oxidoreductase subunit M
MMLLWLLLVPLVGGVIAWPLRGRAPRWVALATLAVDLALALTLWFGPATSTGARVAELSVPWMPRFGVQLHLAVDGLGFVLILLTIALGFMAVACSWNEIRERVGLFHFCLLWTLTGVIGVFTALDLFLFYFLWELMLVPMYLLIGLWGHERRIYAATKFFLFTQAGSLLMLVAILGLVFVHRDQTGTLTFDYDALLGTNIPPHLQMWLMLGFFVGFAVKLPAVPFHTWLPDAHTEAPTAGSLILAGLLLKTGAYGLLRFAVPLFPQASRTFAPVALSLGVAGVLYGAALAFGQRDLKRLIAYTSVSHLGFVLLGIYAWNELALQGVILQMVAHGLATGGLFVLVGMLDERTHTRDLERLGGLWDVAPRMGALAMILSMAALGLPGLGSFVAEILILLGSFQVHPVLAGIATIGMVFATIYSLWIMQRAFQGPNPGWAIADLGGREVGVLGAMIAALLWLGLYPQPVFDAARAALQFLEGAVPGGLS